LSARPPVLTIGALHAGAADGIVADAAVFADLGCLPFTAATCLWTGSGNGPLPLPPVLFAAALSAGLAQAPRATRVGAVADHDVEQMAALLASHAPDAIVLDPEIAALPISRRAPLLTVATVAVARAGDARDIEGLQRLAARMRGDGVRAVLLTGASLRGRMVDLLDEEGRVTVFDTSRIQAPRIPGLAGAHVTALAAHLARGETLVRAAEAAQRYVGIRLRRGR
jgi:hydroxymethylpyrimidine/phosphomethylpyrimidine kinase